MYHHHAYRGSWVDEKISRCKRGVGNQAHTSLPWNCFKSDAIQRLPQISHDIFNILDPDRNPH